MSEQIEKTCQMKKVKKGSRLVRALKKLLCCCWCSAQQQDEQAEECVAAASPRQGEEEECVREESGSLADSSSETAPSLPAVMCGQSPECESDQSLPEECPTLEHPVREADVHTSSEEDFLSASEGDGESPEENTRSPEDVQEAEQAALTDEALTAICGLIEEPLTPEAPKAPECVEEQGEAERQTERGAARRRRRRKKKTVPHEEEDNGGEWQVVVSKKQRRKKTETATVQDREPPAITAPKLEPQRGARKPKAPRRANKCYQDDRGRVRQSWQESTVTVAVPVPPDRRRHVIGTRGDTIRQLQQQYPAVRVSVPGPQDLTSRAVTIEGPKTQADAVALHITHHLQAIEEQLREAEQRRQERQRVVTKVKVAADMRRHVVGPRGETLRRLAQQHPTIRVTVPAPSDTRTATVTIRGPRGEAAVVADCIRACVQAAGQQQLQRQPNKRKQ